MQQSEPPNPEHAWRTLALMNEWIRHSDAKAGVTLALAGVVGTMVFNLSDEITDWTRFSAAVVIFACFFLGATVVLCGSTLIPRLGNCRRDPELNLLYFAGIAHHYKDRRKAFSDDFSHLSADPEDLTTAITEQIYANARIATTKFRRAQWAIGAILLASLCVGLLALIVGVTTS